jgi:hypothetical protein
MQHSTDLAYSEQEQKFIRLMLDPGAQGNEVSTSCERLVSSLRKRRVTSDDFLQQKTDDRLKQALNEQTLRANKMRAELHELHIQHTRQLEYLANLTTPAVTGRMQWTK